MSATPEAGTSDSVARLRSWPGHPVARCDLPVGAALERDLLQAGRYRNLVRTQTAAAHELRGVLHALALSAQVQQRLLGGVQSPDTAVLAKCSRYAATLVEQIGRLARLAQDLVGQASESQDCRQDLDLGTCIEDSAARVAPLCAQHAVALRVDRARGPLWISGRRERLHQALVSLAIVALDATPRGGTLAIDARMVNGLARIEVRGGGSTPESLDARPWELVAPVPMPEVDTAGLHVVWRVVREHGGRVAAWTRTGGGRVFRIELPGTATA